MNKAYRMLVTLISMLSVAVPQVSIAREMTCREFDALSGVVTHEDFKRTTATSAQFQAFKTVIADHVEKTILLQRFSKRGEALQLVLKDKKFLSFIMSNSLAMTIDFCVDRASAPMGAVAIEQFDYLLDSAAKGHNK